MRSILPKFTHDCERCTFVGRLDGKDCYVCESSVILRNGSEGPDYVAMTKEMAVSHEPYKTVLRMGDQNA